MEATVFCDITKKHWHLVRKYLTLLEIFPLRKINLIFFVYVCMAFWRSKLATSTINLYRPWPAISWLS